MNEIFVYSQTSKVKICEKWIKSEWKKNVNKIENKFRFCNGLPCGLEQSRELRTLSLFFFNCYLAVPWPTLGHSQGDSLTNRMLITVFVHIRPEGHWEPHNEVGSLSPAECLGGFELGTFWFLLQMPSWVLD